MFENIQFEKQFKKPHLGFWANLHAQNWHFSDGLPVF